MTFCCLRAPAIPLFSLMHTRSFPFHFYHGNRHSTCYMQRRHIIKVDKITVVCRSVFPHGDIFHSFSLSSRRSCSFISLSNHRGNLSANDFVPLNEKSRTLLQSGHFTSLALQRLHPREGRAILSRHPLGVSHSCLFRAISIRPRVQRKEKRRAVRVEKAQNV